MNSANVTNSHSSPLQRVLAYLLGMAESKSENPVYLVKQLRGGLGMGASRNNGIKYAIGIMHLVAPVHVRSGQPTNQLRFEICKTLLQSWLNSSFDLSIVIDRWKWVEKKSDLPAQMLALSFRALQQLRPMVIKGEPHGPLVLAVMELALSLFQMALSSARQSLPLRQPFHEYCQVLQDLADKSNAWVLNDSDFLRFHYYLLCFKQVPRLEVPIHNAPLQASLHTYFSSQVTQEKNTNP